MSIKAKIYQPSKTAMQSGRAKTHTWVLEYIPQASMKPESLMGWNSMQDTMQEVRLKFATAEEAITYAKAKQIAYEVIQPHASHVPPKQYAANFAFNRKRAYDQNT